MKQLWISLLKVKPLPDSEYNDWGGAYTTGIVPAGSAEEAQTAFVSSLRIWGLELIECEDLEPFSTRVSKNDLDKSYHDLALQSLKTGEAQFDEFFVWP